jgi:iron complex outermembrane receptor protein
MQSAAAGPHPRHFHSNSSYAKILSAVALVLCAAGAIGLHAQSAASSTTQQAASPAQAAQQKPAPVKTTVVVHGEVNDNYLPEAVTVGTIDSEPLKDAPLSATVVTRDVMSDQISRLLSDVVKNDASVEDDYVPVGYYGDYQIRGFPVDLATGLKVNGMTIAGEQDVPLENKDSVEFLNGLAGVESGVASGGGLIDYITKRPSAIKALDVATDERGTAYGAADLGRFFGARQQVGARINLAIERIQTYMNGTEGWRAVGAGAADWKISPRIVWKNDFEYQHKTERDGSGFQLLGGATLPNINQIYPSTMLGEQAWAPPDTYDTFNAGTRFNFILSPNWTAFVAGSFSHSLIQDNVIYAYGASLDPNNGYAVNCPNAPYAPAYFFCPDGTYGIYDYRDPGELRIDAEAEAMVTGHIKTGVITQDITVGGELFLRSVQQPGYYSFANPYSPDGIVQDGAVYWYLGSENIYQPMTPYPIEDPVQQAGPRRLWEDSHQSSAVVQDRLHLPGRIQLIAGARYDMLHDHNYSLFATTPCVPSSTPGPPTDPCPTMYDASSQPAYSVPNSPSLADKPVWLPQFAATFNPVANLTLYANYGVLLSLGPEAPWWVDNGSQFLSPYNTRQVELGAKYEPSQRILLGGALFHMHAPFFYPKTLAGADSFCPAGNAGDQCFESEGRETHNGIELNAEGKAANWLRLAASAAAIDATADDSGTPAYDNKQVINVPHLHTTLFADVAVPHARGLAVMPGWTYSGRKEATRDDTVSVPGYNVFNLGLRYTPGGEGGRATFRVYASNVADKRYWSDTGASYGDTFIWLGAPTTVRLSAHYTF